MPLPIENYALIGDTHSAALVGTDGSIDWLCLPRFDSPGVFSALLGGPSDGHWQLCPAGEVTSVHRRYRDETMVLETDFVTPTGRARVIDFMPVRDRRADVMRVVECVDGTVEMRMEWVIRFDYGEIVPWVQRRFDADGRPAITAIGGPDAVCLRGDPLPEHDSTDHRHTVEFTVAAGERRTFSMTWYPSSDSTVPTVHDADEQLPRTERFWRSWARKCKYRGPYRAQVVRSALTLKALTYEPTGGIVAAPTTSLPEQLGGERNWDYRYCWLRDASLTLRSMLDHGYRSEAKAWRSWLLRSVAGDPEDLQILYGVAGERRLFEWTVDTLDGYQGAKPVRIGNAASGQLQLDVYGEVLDALHEARVEGIKEDDFSWPLQLALADNLLSKWDQPDNGIWEVRGELRHFTHSRMMVWVALDRLVQAVERSGLPGDVERWRTMRDEVHEEILTKGWNDEVGAFTQYYGGSTVDAAVLLMPQMGFLPADDERFVSTMAVIERELRDGPFVKRYSTEPTEADKTAVDGLSPGEGAFLMCSFWLVRAYAMAGRTEEATELFDQLLGLCNDVGLLAEEYDIERNRMLGNFPQAFSHLALISAAQAVTTAGAPDRGRVPEQSDGPGYGEHHTR
ncbi:glycoside hydrolase family 15 protein [Actinocatenispora sera]|uniref:Trehalase n=1 Tax=Actinocatenispora sera TaxID=390989 RepID=A0A810L3C4_9ACTN|nr:glycoside hydrolase family 15 protein [Actinocatenispora sera]BCJ28906.1 glucoamylase [Actinocatenispora sera]